MAARINARLGNALASKLRRTQTATRKSVTAIVCESIDRYCDEVLRDERSPRSRLAAAGFIGCAAGAPDLSTNYKKLLAGSLERKT